MQRDQQNNRRRRSGSSYIHGSPVLKNFVAVSALNAEPGDIIEIDRTIYTHWALYCGNGLAVHVSGQKSEISQKDAECRVERLADIAGSSLVRVNNKEVPAKERDLTPLPVETILSNAMSYVGSDCTYDLLNRSCEYYVTLWRYGTGWSDQAIIAYSVMSMLSNNVKDQKSAHNVMMNSIQALLQCNSKSGISPPSSQ